MSEPDFEFNPQPGQATRVTLASRQTPWHIRIGENDLYVAVTGGTTEPNVGPEADVAVEAEGGL